MPIQRTAVTVGLAGILAWPGAGWAATGTTADILDKLQQQIDQQQRRIDAAERALATEQRKLEATRKQLEELRGRGTDQARNNQAQNGEGKNAPAQTRQASNEQPQKKQPEAVGQAPSSQAKSPPSTAAISEQTGILTPRGHFVLEPSLEYLYNSNSQVSLIGFTIIPAITVGLINVQQVHQSTLIGALTGRYGLTNRLEFEAKVPYVYRDQQTVGRPLNVASAQNQVFNASGNDIGDIEAAVRYQFNQGGPSTPYFIGGLRGIFPTGRDPFEVKYAPASVAAAGTLIQEQLPTGAGFYGVQPSFTAIFPSDPAVFFGGVSYLYNFSRDVNKTIGGSYIGRVDPGDQIEFNFGMGLALNDRSSVSLGYKHTFVGKTRYNGTFASDATSTQLGQLLIGYSYSFTPSTTLNVSLGAGLTKDTPDVDLTVRVPMLF